MKRITIPLAIMAALALSACGSTTTPSGAGPTVAPGASGTTTTPTVAPGASGTTTNAHGDVVVNGVTCPGSGTTAGGGWVGCQGANGGLVFCKWVQTEEQRAAAQQRGVVGEMTLTACTSTPPKS